MCGINGITWNDLDLIAKMNKVTKRRGPDGTSMDQLDNVSFGHNLLSIMSDQPVRQPYHHDGGMLTFNGAIFNFRELGYEGSSDTEVLAKGLAAEGKDFLKKCRGMWALGWYKNGKLTLARDHFGIKPLYYKRSEKGIQFSSSIMALESDRKLQLFAFAMYRQFGYVPGYLTLFDDCYKVTPGEIIEFSVDTQITATDNLWMEFDFEPDQEYNPTEWQEKLEKAVSESHFGYRQRGVFLSGGLDSTSVSHYLNEKNTFTSRYTNTERDFNDDADIAAKFAEDYGLNHTEIEINPVNFYESLDTAIEALELPVFNKSTPSYWYINKQLKDAGTVVTYSGDGGDEMYCGYITHDRYGNHENPFRDHYRAIAWKPKKRLNVTDQRFEMGEDQYVQYMESWFPSRPWRSDHLNNCLFIEMLTRVSEDFLTRNDKFGSYFGMEGRFPLLNQEWFRYIMKIPSSVKMKNGGEGKYIAREGLKTVLPDYVINKAKTGWSIPDNEWRKEQIAFREKMIDIIREPVGNNIDRIVDWNRADGVKTFYAAAYFKKWCKKFGVSLG